MKFSIIIFGYNQEKNIEATINDYLKTFPSCKLIVMADGCTDNTPKIVRKFEKNVILIAPKKRLGKGGAFLKALNYANTKITGFVDGDGSISAKEFKKVLRGIKNADCAIASRWKKGAKVLKISLKRKIMSKLFNLFVRLFFNLKFKDTQCGAKVFRKNVIEYIKKVGLLCKGYEFDVELLYKIKKFKINEVPITWINKAYSTLTLKAIFAMFINLIKLRFKKA